MLVFVAAIGLVAGGVEIEIGAGAQRERQLPVQREVAPPELGTVPVAVMAGDMALVQVGIAGVPVLRQVLLIDVGIGVATVVVGLDWRVGVEAAEQQHFLAMCGKGCQPQESCGEGRQPMTTGAGHRSPP
ncbi:hypothetical protein D3C85_1480920 [compost metagenome]